MIKLHLNCEDTHNVLLRYCKILYPMNRFQSCNGNRQSISNLYKCEHPRITTAASYLVKSHSHWWLISGPQPSNLPHQHHNLQHGPITTPSALGLTRYHAPDWHKDSPLLQVNHNSPESFNHTSQKGHIWLALPFFKRQLLMPNTKQLLVSKLAWGLTTFVLLSYC